MLYEHFRKIVIFYLLLISLKETKPKNQKKKAKAVRNTKKIANSFGKIRNDETAEIQSEFKENIPLLNVHSTYYTHVSYLF